MSKIVHTPRGVIYSDGKLFTKHKSEDVSQKDAVKRIESDMKKRGFDADEIKRRVESHSAGRKVVKESPKPVPSKEEEKQD